MKPLLTLLSATALAALVSPVWAAGPTPPPVHCTPDGRACTAAGLPMTRPAPPKAPQPVRPPHHKHDHKADHRHHGHPHHAHRPHHPKPPALGQRARNGQPFAQARNSRFPLPPQGQEYRVYQDHLVLVDQRNSQILRVLGPIDQVLR